MVKSDSDDEVNNANSISYDELQHAFDDLVIEFKNLSSRNKILKKNNSCIKLELDTMINKYEE